MTTQTGPNTENAMVLTPRQERLIAVRDEMAPGAKPSAIVPRNFVEAQEMCRALAHSGLIPRAYSDRPQDLIVTVMSGAEIGLPPMASLRLYHLMDGIPRLSAEGIRAVVMTSNECEYFEVATCDEKHATWIGKRPGRPEKSVTWTIERAKKAGLWDRKNRDGSLGNWQKYTEEMLNARASMQLARMIWPNVIAGMLSREEAQDGDFIDAQSTEKPAFVAPPPGFFQTMGSTTGGGGGGSGHGAVIIGVATNKIVTPVGPPPGVPQVAAEPAKPPKASKPKAAERPTPPPTSSDGASGSAGETSSGSTAPSTASTLPPAVSPVADTAPTGTVDRWGQNIADPTPAVVAPAAPTTSGAVAAVPPPAASDEGFGGEDPYDKPAPADEVAVKLSEFHDWLASCGSQAALKAGLGTWTAWTAYMSDRQNDLRFRKNGEITIQMQTAYSKRKGEVPA